MFSRADYLLNYWDSTWQDVLAELTAIKAALQKKNTARTLLRKHLLAYLEILDSVCEVVHLMNLDWASLMKHDPKRMCKKKLLDKKHEIERTYNKLIEAIYTLLNEPVEAPQLVENKLVD